MKLFASFRDWIKALTATAEDPRLQYVDPFQRHRELLAKVRGARQRLGGTRRELEAKLNEARDDQRRLRDPANQDVFASQLSEIVEEELRALQAEVDELDREEKELGLVEQRLMVQEQTFIARQEALSARYSAAEARSRIQEELGGVSQQLSELGVAIEKAEQRSEEARARAVAIEHLAGMGPPSGPATGAILAQRLASSYASEARVEASGPLKRLLSAGFRSLLDLESEYRQLQAVLQRRRDTDPIAIAYIPPLAEETYTQGLRTLSDALNLIQAVRSPGVESLEQRVRELQAEIGALEARQGPSGPDSSIALKQESLGSATERLDMVKRILLRVEELLHQCDECVSALNRTRIELAAIKAGASGTSVDAVTESLRKAIEEARAVQQELKALGL